MDPSFTECVLANEKNYNRQGMNEHVFCLKAGIDDFKHSSARFFTVFLDFRDAFGSLSHDVMLHALDEIRLPQPYVDVIKDVYNNSYVQVICGSVLTDPIPLKIGIKTGCPWSAVNFILAINAWLKWMCQCAPAGVRSPNPVQAYADDVEISSRDESVIHNMLFCTDDFINWSGLDMKHTKCAAFYERRSGGNRWYRSKSDKPPVFALGHKPIRLYERHETYPYLGHKFNVSGDWEEQVTELCREFTRRLALIDSSPLPIMMKIEAIRLIAMAKIKHLFKNVHIPQCTLSILNDEMVKLVRKWLCLNSHTTRDIIFQSRRDGGLGAPNIEWIYTASRTGHLLNMLNNDDTSVRELARESLFLHLQRHKIPAASCNEPQFLGFKLKVNGKLDIKTAGFGVRSDWLDLNDLCQCTGLQLSWQGPDGAVAVLNENIITDPHISTLAVLHTEGTPLQLSTNNVRVSLLHLRKTQSAQHWMGLKLQGKLALLQSADHSVSHSVLTNFSISEDIQIFMIKAQCLPTMYNLSIWYPAKYNSYCLLHQNQQENETVAHILNGCCCYKGLYVSRHDRLVDLIVKDLKIIHKDSKIYQHTTVKLNWFNHSTSDRDYFKNIPNTPDIVIVNETLNTVFVIEVGCSFDLYLDTCYLSKLLKYQPLVEALHQLDYKCKLIILVFGSLGHVHKNVIKRTAVGWIAKKESQKTC